MNTLKIRMDRSGNGNPMVMNLLQAAGFEVSVFNRTKEKERLYWLREQNQQAVYKN
jgi:3-hydroxyisobutyrate dehydrogenase